MISYLKDCEAASLQNFPLCIVGGGAAGISLAVAMMRRGQRVLLVDGGDFAEKPELADAYAGSAQEPHPATTEYRRQRFGGTTHLWGGRCVPLDPVDFERRSHVANSGWPISYEEYAKYLPEALAYCDAGEPDFSVQALNGSTAPMFSELPRFGGGLYERIERYSLPTDFAAKFGDELKRSDDVKVILRARCTRIGLSADGASVDSVVLSDGEREVEVKAARVVLCAGGIEAARLLLCARETAPSWQRFDGSLGRYYACHFDLIFGAMAFSNEKPHFDFQRTKDDVYARRKLQFSREVLSERGLLNSTYRLHFPPYADPGHGSGVLSTIYLAKSILASEYQAILNHGKSNGGVAPRRLAHLGNVVTDMGSVLGFGYDWLFHRKLARRKLPYTLIRDRRGTYPFEFNSEQVPDAGNRIELLDQCDSQGLRRVSVKWRLTGADVDSGVRSFELLRSMLSTTRNSRLDFDMGELKEQVSSALPVGGHHIGSTRMGLSPEHSVVDADCRVHGVDNLFVLSSSIFPTNGHANPTLSIVAFALRLAGHLQATGGPLQ